MKLLNTEIRIYKADRMDVLPAQLRFAEDGEGNCHLMDATITLNGKQVPWTHWVGHIFWSHDRAAFDAHPKFGITLCDRHKSWPARRATREDGMETVLIGDESRGDDERDLAKTSFRDIFTERQREAAELLCEAIGRPAPSAT